MLVPLRGCMLRRGFSRRRNRLAPNFFKAAEPPCTEQIRFFNMATIKGQNLRLLIGGKCVAGATSCTMHIAAQTEDSSTKDDTGDWTRNEITGLQWDASVDALMPVSDTNPSVRYIEYDNTRTYSEEIILHPGDNISVEYEWDSRHKEYRIEEVTETSEDPITDTSEDANYTNTRTEDMTVRIYWGEAGSDGEIKITNSIMKSLEPILNAMTSKNPVEVRLNRTAGDMNRVTSEQLLVGHAIVTDISQSAANRQNVAYTAQLTGTGELEIVENE